MEKNLKKNYGIDGPFNEILKSYLSKRKIYSHVNGTNSDCKSILFGVPQGSVLGPILFSLYINDLKMMADNAEINLFADDTSLFCVGKNDIDLKNRANKALTDLSEWLKINRLTLNINKTHFIDFSKIKNPNLKLHLGNTEIVKETKTKYLGIIIQENLKWDEHIKIVIKKLNQQIPLYYFLRKVIPKDKKKLVFKSLSLSIINYGIELFGRCNTKWLRQLQRTQNRLLKILESKPKLYSTSLIHKNSKILKIVEQAKLRLALLNHRVIYNSVSLNVAHKSMRLQAGVHRRNLRNNLNFHVDINAYQKLNKIVEQSTIVWNDLENQLKSIKNRNKFKESVSIKFLDSYA